MTTSDNAPENPRKNSKGVLGFRFPTRERATLRAKAREAKVKDTDYARNVLLAHVCGTDVCAFTTAVEEVRRLQQDQHRIMLAEHQRTRAEWEDFKEQVRALLERHLGTLELVDDDGNGKKR